jgi:hypothetical protein
MKMKILPLLNPCQTKHMIEIVKHPCKTSVPFDYTFTTKITVLLKCSFMLSLTVCLPSNGKAATLVRSNIILKYCNSTELEIISKY